MTETVVISCANIDCGQELRVPNRKPGMVKCPACKTDWRQGNVCDSQAVVDVIRRRQEANRLFDGIWLDAYLSTPKF